MGDVPNTILQARTKHLRQTSGVTRAKSILRPGHHWYSPAVEETIDSPAAQQTQHDINLTQPVQHEENLSQYAQHEENLSQDAQLGGESFDPDEPDDQPPLDSSSDDTDLDDSIFPLTISVNQPTTNHLHENKIAIARGGGAYNNMMPLFQQLTNMADTDPYLYDILWQSLNGASALMNSVARNGIENETGKMLSLPDVDRTRKCSRKRQRTSPKKGRK